jgi:hypothetical protein
MVAGNYESLEDKCLIGTVFTKVVRNDSQGFEWINEAKAAPRPKWGYIATKVGAVGGSSALPVLPLHRAGPQPEVGQGMPSCCSAGGVRHALALQPAGAAARAAAASTPLPALASALA